MAQALPVEKTEKGPALSGPFLLLPGSSARSGHVTFGLVLFNQQLHYGPAICHIRQNESAWEPFVFS